MITYACAFYIGNRTQGIKNVFFWLVIYPSKYNLFTCSESKNNSNQNPQTIWVLKALLMHNQNIKQTFVINITLSHDAGTCRYDMNNIIYLLIIENTTWECLVSQQSRVRNKKRRNNSLHKTSVPQVHFHVLSMRITCLWPSDTSAGTRSTCFGKDFTRTFQFWFTRSSWIRGKQNARANNKLVPFGSVLYAWTRATEA